MKTGLIPTILRVGRPGRVTSASADCIEARTIQVPLSRTAVNAIRAGQPFKYQAVRHDEASTVTHHEDAVTARRDRPHSLFRRITLPLWRRRQLGVASKGSGEYGSVDVVEQVSTLTTGVCRDRYRRSKDQSTVIAMQRISAQTGRTAPKLRAPTGWCQAHTSNTTKI
jgi:hypothetical protein